MPLLNKRARENGLDLSPLSSPQQPKAVTQYHKAFNNRAPGSSSPIKSSKVSLTRLSGKHTNLANIGLRVKNSIKNLNERFDTTKLFNRREVTAHDEPKNIPPSPVCSPMSVLNLFKETVD
jgi:hypothetical protein